MRPRSPQRWTDGRLTLDRHSFRPLLERPKALRIEFLNRVGVVPEEKIATPRPTPVEQCAQEFECYLREERVLATPTIINYMPFIRCFPNDCFGGGTVKLSRLCAGDVVGFV